jgi:hypothetical protein
VVVAAVGSSRRRRWALAWERGRLPPGARWKMPCVVARGATIGAAGRQGPAGGAPSQEAVQPFLDEQVCLAQTSPLTRVPLAR